MTQASEATRFYLHTPDGAYWLKRPSDANGQISWIHENELNANNMPSEFTASEVEYIRRNASKDVRAIASSGEVPKPLKEPEQQPVLESEQQSPEEQTSPNPEPQNPNPKRQNRPMAKKQSPEQQEPSDWLQHVPTLFLWLLLGLLVLGIGAACAINTQPFIEMTRLIVGDMGIDGSRIPIIGWLLGLLGIGLIYLVGITWWAIALALELAPTLMTASDKRTLRMINSVLNHTGVEIKAGDSAELRWLKSKYNNRPIASLAFFRACRLFVYTMELVICWITHPPIQGNPADFIIALVTGQFDRINWGNVFLTLSVLFLVEILVKIALHTISHIHADRQLARAEKEAQQQ